MEIIVKKAHPSSDWAFSAIGG